MCPTRMYMARAAHRSLRRWCSGFGIWVYGLWFMVHCQGFRIEGWGLKVYRAGHAWVEGLGFRV